MFSIICVYNDDKIIHDNLLKSLESQDRDYELILVDNTRSTFKSAAKALNHGGAKANCENLMFIHQDVVLPTPSFLDKFEKNLEAFDNFFIAGVAGVGLNDEPIGKVVNLVDPYRHLWSGKIISMPEDVFILDECLFVVPVSLFKLVQFDEKIPGWHTYGVDYCLTASYFGVKSYVVPLGIIHNSVLSSLYKSNVFRSELYVYRKHRQKIKRITTMMGELSFWKLLLNSVRSLSPHTFIHTFKLSPLRKVFDLTDRF